MNGIEFAGYVSHELRNERLRQNMSVNALADVSGVAKSTIFSLECKSRTMNVSTLAMLCEGMAVRPSEILRRAEEALEREKHVDQ